MHSWISNFPFTNLLTVGEHILFCNLYGAFISKMMQTLKKMQKNKETLMKHVKIDNGPVGHYY
jgi:hypothetical protein